MLSKIDVWIGKRIFHPPIIWICQRTSFSQYSISKYAWWLATVLILANWTIKLWVDWIGFVFVAIMLVGRTLFVSVLPHRQTESWRPLRYMILIFGSSQLLIDIFLGNKGFQWSVHLVNFLAMTGEYALTITTIPPRKKKQTKPVVRLAPSA